MNHYFRDYRWVKGKPVGVTSLQQEQRVDVNFKIVVDPYFKRYTIERYTGTRFETTVYDSSLLDFRKISPQEQMAWERESLEKSETEETALIRDIHDRIILQEKYFFEEGFCRRCEIYSPHGIQVALQKMYYKKLKDPFDGVRLYDLLGHVVMEKKYSTDPLGNFSELLEESWEMV